MSFTKISHLAALIFLGTTIIISQGCENSGSVIERALIKTNQACDDISEGLSSEEKRYIQGCKRGANKVAREVVLISGGMIVDSNDLETDLIKLRIIISSWSVEGARDDIKKLNEENLNEQFPGIAFDTEYLREVYGNIVNSCKDTEKEWVVKHCIFGVDNYIKNLVVEMDQALYEAKKLKE